MSSTRRRLAPSLVVAATALMLSGCSGQPAEQSQAQAAASAQAATPAAAPVATPVSAPVSAGTAAPAPAPVAGVATPKPETEADQKPVNIPDAKMPPLPMSQYPAARPMDVVNAVFKFAARRPDVLSKVPCFCGCERMGHRGNDDCFVKARDARGIPTEWEEHGLG